MVLKQCQLDATDPGPWILDPDLRIAFAWIRIHIKARSGSGPVKYFFRPCYTGDNYSFYHRRRLEREDKAKVEFILFF